MSLPTNKWR